MNSEDKAKVPEKKPSVVPNGTSAHGKPVLGKTGTGTAVKKVDKVIGHVPQGTAGEQKTVVPAGTSGTAVKKKPAVQSVQEGEQPKRVSSASAPVGKAQPKGTGASGGGSSASAAKKPVKKTAAKGKKKQKGATGETFMRLGRGIKAGSVTVGKYGKKALTAFDTFATSQVEEDQSDVFFKRIVARLGLTDKLKFSTFIIGSIILLIVMLVLFNNTSLEVEHVTVSIAGLDSDLEGYTICLISDLHGREFGTKQATLLRSINGEEYDLMLMAGDMVGIKGDPQPLYDLIDGLDGNAPIYFIAGDSDPGPLRDKPNQVEGTLDEWVLDDWVLGAIDRGAIYLDSPESLQVEDAIIWFTPGSMQNVESSSTVSALNLQEKKESDAVLAGRPEAYDALPFTAYRQQNMLRLQESILEMDGEDLHISLTHIPPVEPIRTSDGKDGYLPTVDLIVAGHYCGGVWRVPMLGALYIPAVEADRHGWLPAQDHVSGLRMLGSANLYVTAGLGVTDRIHLPDFRFYNQPKITILHLTAKLTDDLLGLND